MQLVYMDEAGTSSGSQEPYCLYGAIIIHGDHGLKPLKRELDRLVLKHIPEEQRAGFVFHATDLFGRSNDFDTKKHPYWSDDEKRFLLADDLAKIPKEHHLWIAVGAVLRDSPTGFDNHPGLTNKSKVIGNIATAFVVCSAQVDRWMRRYRKNENCLLYVENNPPAHAMLKEVQKIYTDKRMANFPDERARELWPYRHIEEEPSFREKSPSSPLQLADFCTFIYKRYALMEDERYARFFDPMRDRFATF